MIKLITDREKEIIEKKMKGLSLTQNESNILSKFVRPKLREINKINAGALLDKLEYNQKGRSIENSIKRVVTENIKKVQALVLYGSAIQTNYKRYKDIDLLIITKEKTWKSLREKYDAIMHITSLAKDIGLNLDIQIIDKKSFYYQYPHNPSLIYQLKDYKVIYGKINIPKKVELSKLGLRMKLDWSDIEDEESDGGEIYQSLRNVILVKLLLNKIVDNEYLRESISREIGNNIISKLKNNTVSKIEKRLILRYIKELSEKTDKEIKDTKWEKIEL